MRSVELYDLLRYSERPLLDVGLVYCPICNHSGAVVCMTQTVVICIVDLHDNIMWISFSLSIPDTNYSTPTLYEGAHFIIVHLPLEETQTTLTEGGVVMRFFTLNTA